MATKGQVTKIYRLETVGYDVVHGHFTKLSDDLAKIKKQIIELQGKKLGLGGKDLEKVNRDIAEASRQQTNLQQKITSTNASTKESIAIRKEEMALLKASGNENAKAATSSAGAYYELNKQYQAAKKNALDLATAHGIESKEAIEATVTAEAYKQQLIQINALLKSGGKPAIAASSPEAKVIPFTTNLDDLERERNAIVENRDALSDLDREQAEVSMSAAEFGNANKVAGDKVEDASQTVGLAATKYEQYTGVMRDNIRAHVENEQALLANRTQQKELETVMKQSGVATDSQIAKLSTLRGEEVLLVETNKALNLTIRNQAKELISANGSLDEGQAQLNQLQQSYEQLSDVEKASPFGQGMKKEIDELEPKVKSLEAELGKFQRNVGNYPAAFDRAFQNLNSELDQIRGKLVNGNFSGKELATLTAQEKALASATKILGTEFTSTAQAAAAYKEAGRQLSATFGVNSQVFKTFSAEVAVGNQEIKNADKQLTKTAASGDKVTKTFTSVYGGLRKLANLLPGLGISSLILLAIAPLEAFASTLGNAFTKMGKKSKEASTGMESLKKQIELTNDAIEKSSEEFIQAFTNVETLRINVKLAKEGFIDKKKVVDEYNTSMGETTGQVKSLDEVERRLVEAGPAYIKMMLLKAASQMAVQSAAKETFEAQLKYEKDLARVQNITRKGEKERDKEAGADGLSEFLGAGEKNIAEDAKAKSEKRIVTLKGIAEKFQKDAAEIAKDFKFDFFSGYDAKPAKTTDALKNAFADIDAERARLLAIENKRVNEIKKLRELTFDEEEEHLKALEKINVDALTKKIATYAGEKKLTRVQLKDKAEFAEEVSSIELDTSTKINAIQKKRFEQRLKEIELELDSELLAIKEKNDVVQDNILSTELQKAQAQLDADEATLAAHEKFYDQLIQLNVNYNKEAVQKAKEGISEIQRVLIRDRNNVSLSTLKDLERAGDMEVRAININFEKARNSILNNGKLTERQRKKQLEKLEIAQRRTVLSKELEILNAQLAVKKALLALSLIANEDYQKAVKAAIDKLNELNGLNSGTNDAAKKKLQERFRDLKSFISANISDLFNYEEGDEESDAIGEMIGKSYEFAFEAMASFYDAERQRIEDNLELQLQRLDMEKEQVIARAQSQAEIESIEKQYATKKRRAEIAAGEQLKKTRRAEAKIALAAELANIWVQAAVYPPPFNLIVGGVLSGLALGRYGLRVGEINREKFEFGGQPGEVPTRGGEFGGRSHGKGGTPFTFKGRTHEAEVKELAIVRTKGANPRKKYKVEGTQMQIASAANMIGGGINFKPGAKLSKYETGGYLGDYLQAPVFTPSMNTSIIHTDSETKEQLKQIANNLAVYAKATDNRFDRLRVAVSEKDISNSQRKATKQSSIGSF